MSIAQSIQWKKKYKFSGNLIFQAAFRIGSGKPGESGSDLGVLLSPDGEPILPGSSLKGKFRSTVEKLCYLLNMKACMLDKNVSLVDCVSDQEYYQSINNTIKEKNSKQRYEWLTGINGKRQICDVCWLFGSLMSASRLFFQDARLLQWSKVVEHRDGVVIDRDSERAVEGLKYDFEVIPANTSFEIQIEVENPEDLELSMIAIGLSEWEQGIRLGGGTSRGLGMAKLENLKIQKVDFSNPESYIPYLCNRTMQEVTPTDWAKILKNQLTEISKEISQKKTEGN